MIHHFQKMELYVSLGQDNHNTSHFFAFYKQYVNDKGHRDLDVSTLTFQVNIWNIMNNVLLSTANLSLPMPANDIMHIVDMTTLTMSIPLFHQ